MKYMTFPSSCSFAGLANLLVFYGVDTEDYEIALGMELPYLFAHEAGKYLSGPMLQGAKWFNLYLNPLGFALSERDMEKKQICSYLSDIFPAMLGIRVSSEGKHAVIYTGRQDEKYLFLNNRRKDSPEPETLSLTAGELLNRLDELVTVGCLVRVASESRDFRPLLENSVLVFQRLREEIHAFSAREQSAASLKIAMDGLFRPVLLDGVTMLELLGEVEIADMLKDVRMEFLSAVKTGHAVILTEMLDMQRLDDAMDQYEHLLINHVGTK